MSTTQLDRPTVTDAAEELLASNSHDWLAHLSTMGTTRISGAALAAVCMAEIIGR